MIKLKKTISEFFGFYDHEGMFTFEGEKYLGGGLEFLLDSSHSLKKLVLTVFHGDYLNGKGEINSTNIIIEFDDQKDMLDYTNRLIESLKDSGDQIVNLIDSVKKIGSYVFSIHSSSLPNIIKKVFDTAKEFPIHVKWEKYKEIINSRDEPIKIDISVGIKDTFEGGIDASTVITKKR